MKRILILIVAVLLYTNAIADTWVINKVEIYTKATNKTKVIETPRGTAFIDFDNQFVTFPGEYEQGIFWFNHYEGGVYDHRIRYTMMRKDLSIYSSKEISFTYFDSPFSGKSEGLIVVSDKGGEKTFSVCRENPSMLGEDYLTYLSGKFDGIGFKWFYLADDAKGNLYFSKDETISAGNGKIKVWVKVLMKETLKFKGVYYKEMELKFIFNTNCDSKMVMTETYYYYSSKGDLIETAEGEFTWDHIIPETVGEQMAKRLCEIFNH